MSQKKKKDPVVKIYGQEITIPEGSKVKDVLAEHGIEVPPLKVDSETCKGCQMCEKVCPTGAITGEKKEVHVLDQDKCEQCGECLAACKLGSIVPA